MEKEFIPYEQALALKELGFDEKCIGIYYNNGKNFIISETSMTNSELDSYKSLDSEMSTPLYQQAFRWFREKYGIYSSINSFHCVNSIKPFGLQIDYFVKGIWQYYESDDELNFNTYEEAELECLKKLIELCNTHKQ